MRSCLSPAARSTLFFSLWVLWTLAGVPGHAQSPAPWASGAAGQSRPEDLVVTLVTIDPSGPVYTWWGHSALIVEDTRLQAARLYNYGLFSFEQSNFVGNFAMGRLWFHVGAVPARRELEYYSRAGRSIRLQTLDLPPDKRLEAARFLENNILPANRTYLYDHYYDNCATRVRDLIDRLVDGQLFAATNQPSGSSLRQATRRYTERHPFMDWLLTFLMSEAIDAPVTEWEQMFLPGELERHVGALVYRDGQGRARALVSTEELYYEAPGAVPIPDQARPLWPRGLAVGIILGAAAAAFGYWASRGGRAGRVLFGVYNALVGLALGTAGTVLLFMSKFTDHWVTYSNENLFLVNPLALLPVPLGIALAAGSRRGERRLAVLWFFLSAVAVAYLMLKALPAFGQNNWAAVATLLPVLLGCSGGFVLLGGWRRQRP